MTESDHDSPRVTIIYPPGDTARGIEDALAGDRLLLLATQRDSDIEDPEPDDLHRIGTVVMVMPVPASSAASDCPRLVTNAFDAL